MARTCQKTTGRITGREAGFFLLYLTAFLFFQLTLSGCLYYGKYRFTPPATLALPPPIPDYFDYPKDPISFKASSISDRGNYTVQKIRFTNHNAFLYLPQDVRPGPAIVILPITNGNYHTKEMAHYLAARGFVGLRIDSRGGDFARVRTGEKPIEAFENFLRDYVIDVLRSVDWLVEHHQVDPERIGIMGISMGGIVAAIATGIDPRIKAGVFMLAGGNLPGIIFSTQEPSLIEVRKRMEDAEDLTRQELLREIESRLQYIDPLAYADPIHSSKILMINAHFDRVIRRKHTMALWKASGKPPLIQLPTGHYTAALFFDYAERKTAAHFEKVLVKGLPTPLPLTDPTAQIK